MAGFVHHRPLSPALSPFVPLARPAGVWVSLPLGREPTSGPSLMGLVSALTRRIAAYVTLRHVTKTPTDARIVGSAANHQRETRSSSRSPSSWSSADQTAAGDRRRQPEDPTGRARALAPTGSSAAARPELKSAVTDRRSFHPTAARGQGLGTKCRI